MYRSRIQGMCLIGFSSPFEFPAFALEALVDGLCDGGFHEIDIAHHDWRKRVPQMLMKPAVLQIICRSRGGGGRAGQTQGREARRPVTRSDMPTVPHAPCGMFSRDSSGNDVHLPAVGGS